MIPSSPTRSAGSGTSIGGDSGIGPLVGEVDLTFANAILRIGAVTGNEIGGIPHHEGRRFRAGLDDPRNILGASARHFCHPIAAISSNSHEDFGGGHHRDCELHRILSPKEWTDRTWPRGRVVVGHHAQTIDMLCDSNPVIDPIATLSCCRIEENGCRDREKFSFSTKGDREFFDELHPDRASLLPRASAIFECESLEVEIDSVEVLRADKGHDGCNRLSAILRLREDLLKFEFLGAIGQSRNQEVACASKLCQRCIHGNAGIAALVKIKDAIWSFECVPEEHHLSDEIVVVERCRK